MRISNFIVILLCSIFLPVTELLAQNQVCGKVIDTEGKPLSFANVYVISEDSTLQAGEVTDSMGCYTVNL